MLDKTDKAILRLLQQNARMPNAEIARKIKLAPSAVLKRIQRMEQEKIITGYEAKIDPRALGLGMGSFIKIHADEKLGEVAVGKKIAALPLVALLCQGRTGEQQHGGQQKQTFHGCEVVIRV